MCLELDLKILSAGISLNFEKPFSYDEFTYALKSEGFEQKFYTIGRMIGTDSKGRPLKQNLEKNYPEQSSDKYNLLGKYCMAHPYDRMLIIGHNFTQDEGLDKNQIRNFVNEIKFVLDMFWSTTKMSQDNIAEGTVLALVTVSDSEKLFSSNESYSEFSFEDMELKEYDEGMILNPDFHRDMNPKDISKYIQSHPEVIKKTDGWGEIKIKHANRQFLISFEYRTKNPEEMIKMVENPDVYCSDIIQRFNNN